VLTVLVSLGLAALALGGPLAATAQAADTPSSLALDVSPSPAVTNQPVTLFAAVNPNGGSADGTITFFATGQVIAGCASQTVTTAQPTATCVTAFRASAAPGPLSATFTPATGSNEAGATASTGLKVDRATTSATVSVPSPTTTPGATVTYTARISPAYQGDAVPTGTVQFRDQGEPIAGCASQALTATDGAATAACHAAPVLLGTHDITAVYRGAQDFQGDTSPAQLIGVQPAPGLGPVNATMQWSFFYAPAYAKVLSLLVHGAPAGAAIHLGCRGAGCPFQNQTTRIVKHASCHRTASHRCGTSAPGTVQLAASFRHRALRVGARITVAIVQRQAVGKYYRFTFRARRGPLVTISCLAPGALRPGKAC
jgi:hypothetical protein